MTKQVCHPVPDLPKVGITLVDFKIEFGHLADGRLVMSDDITPTPPASGTSRPATNLQDRFRHDRAMSAKPIRPFTTD